MAKRAKGLTFEQKCKKMLNIFTSSKDVLNMAQLQKQSVKAGIILPSVKEVLDSLKADDLVNSDKIGAGNFFWSFPSKTHQILLERVQQTKQKIEQLRSTRAALEKSIAQAKIGRQQTQQRSLLEKQLAQLKVKKKKLEQSMSKYVRFDPERIDLIKKENNEIVKRANFWTDNIYQLTKYIKNNTQMTSQQIKQVYDIDVDIDYLQML